MSSKIPSTSFFSTSKRSACDRCRAHKLRCPARQSSTQPCLRCVRAGIPCVTGYTQPLGKYSRDAEEIPSSTNAPISSAPIAVPSSIVTPESISAGQTSVELGSQSSTWNESPSSIAKSGSMDMGDVNLSNWLMHEKYIDGNPAGPSYWPRPISENTLDIFGLDQPSSTTSSSLAMLAAERDSSSLDGSDMLSFLQTPLDSDLVGLGDDISSFLGELQYPGQSSSGLEETMSRAECDLHLSQLNLELCRQTHQHVMRMNQANSAATDSEIVSKKAFESAQDGDPSGSNAFGDALCSTGKFLAIIQSYCRIGVYLTQDEQASPAPLDCTCILAILISYLRLVSIFDSLLLRLQDLLCSGAPLETLPGLKLAGFVVQQGNFQTKVLIQAIQHQFEMIERTLGLPLELRVSDQADDYSNGVFENRYMGILIQTILDMQRIDLQCTSGEEEPLKLGRKRSTGSLASLRGTIIKIKQIMNM